jgi:Secretion system C-terminal sorting domain
MGSGNGNIVFSSNSENTSSTPRIATFGIESPAGNRTFHVRQWGKSSGIANKTQVRLDISPNPVIKLARVNVLGADKYQEKQITLFDLTGRMVYQDIFASDTYIFDRRELVPGIYLLQVKYQPNTTPLLVKLVLE